MNNNAGKISVLIIDEQALTRFGLKTALSADQNISRILEAENKTKGIKLAKDSKPDIVIIKLDHPANIETTKEIKSADENIKIIILTSHNGEEEVLDVLCAGAQAYCVKTITPGKLLQIINFINDGALWFDPVIAGNIQDMLVQKRKNSKSQLNGVGTDDENNGKIMLTGRELDVLQLIVDGYSNAEISEKLFVSIHTAKAHVCNILHKLSVEDRTQAAIKALKDNII